MHVTFDSAGVNENWLRTGREEDLKKEAVAHHKNIRKKDNLETFFQIDPLFNGLYKEAQIKTQMEATDNELRRQRHYVLNYLLLNTDLKSGDVCEVGCWRGLSAYQIATLLKIAGHRCCFSYL